MPYKIFTVAAEIKLASLAFWFKIDVGSEVVDQSFWQLLATAAKLFFPIPSNIQDS